MTRSAPPQGLLTALTHALEAIHPSSILHVRGRVDTCMLDTVLNTLDTVVIRMQPQRLHPPPATGMEAFPVGIGCGRMGLQSAERARHTLSRLRDLYCRRVLLITPIGVPEDEAL